MPKYNVLYIHTHDTGRGIQPYDPSVQTPNLMELAGRGVTFRNAFCVGPTCSPSRSGLLTGQYPHENGMLGLAHRGFSLNDYRKHLANFLHRNGYETFLCGMQHEAADEKNIGYDHTYVAPKGSEVGREQWDVMNAGEAMRCLRLEHEKPFFLSFGMEYTHKPYPEVDKEINPDFVKVPACLPDTPQTRKDYAGFLTSAKRADVLIGRMMQTLKEEGLYDNTIILYTTDHGIALPHMKCTLYDTGIGVALILSAPGYRNGIVCDGIVSQVDVYPTLCEMLELEKPEWLRGYSMMPMIRQEKEDIRESVFAQINFHAARDPQRAVRTRRYKYIKRYSAEVNHYVPCNIDSGDAKEFLVENGLLDMKLDAEQLYDLYLDPNERHNVANDPAYQDVLQSMRVELRKVQDETGDTIEREGLQVVPSAILNTVDCYDADSTDTSDFEGGKMS